jgi:hypothetical protein
MESPVTAAQPPLNALLARLRDTLQAQGEAFGADDFANLDRLITERDQLVAALAPYAAADVTPEDRRLLAQIGALDQRLLEQVRVGQAQTSHDLGDVHRGRGALRQYQRRNQNLIRNLSQLDFKR